VDVIVATAPGDPGRHAGYDIDPIVMTVVWIR